VQEQTLRADPGASVRIPAVARAEQSAPLRSASGGRRLADVLTPAAKSFIGRYVDLASPGTVSVNAQSHLDMPFTLSNGVTALVHTGRLNDVRWFNKFFIAINKRMSVGGTFVCKLETLHQRHERFQRKYPLGLVTIIGVLSFLLHRVFPKLPITKRIYFALTRGRNRRVSEVEALGRLYCCGFEVLETREIDGLLHIVARKAGDSKEAPSPSYGPLFTMRRVGRFGKPIYVYKLRTMYPYSEYLREYVYVRNGLEGCRVRDDFRVTRWGGWMRRRWIDELPMLINLVNGDLKLVGGRPLSEHHESLYPPDFVERRRRYRPGLVPPFYADLPATFDGTVASEIAYLDAYERAPIRTDVHYLCKAIRNIATGRARSS
jgi:hypothetical protein